MAGCIEACSVRTRVSYGRSALIPQGCQRGTTRCAGRAAIGLSGGEACANLLDQPFIDGDKRSCRNVEASQTARALAPKVVEMPARCSRYQYFLLGNGVVLHSTGVLASMRCKIEQTDEPSPYGIAHYTV